MQKDKVIPYFVICGERRSGTTTLYNVLDQHPEVSMYKKRDFNFFIEPQLFSRHEIKDAEIDNWEEHASFSNYTNHFENLNGKVGVKNADLLWWKSSHSRLSKYVPNTKFIIILREPISRAISQYVNELRKGRETNSFEKAITRKPNDLNHWEKLHLQYKERGCYIDSLTNFGHYISKENIKVVILEDLKTNWATVLKDICNFLQIDESYIPDIKKGNANKEPYYRRKKFATKGIFKKIFDIWERVTEALIVRLSNDKDIRQNLRYRLRFFYQESFRKQFTIDIKLEKELQRYYKSYNTALEDMLGRKIAYWNYD
ncbi:sulfotransferase [Winogradskyella sp.]|uniref:sulfotransferase family protein n=1 Tax=Winogradskyella sp. TaxID=1883156 RepID=UPI00260BF452|nr:sulfotransferase [Winogradskyella sp.]